jgi:hypothetical protein
VEKVLEADSGQNVVAKNLYCKMCVTPIHQTTHPTTPIIELQLANANTNIVEHKANHSISNSTNPVNYLHLIVMGAVVSILVHNLFDKPTMSRE